MIMETASSRICYRVEAGKRPDTMEGEEGNEGRHSLGNKVLLGSRGGRVEVKRSTDDLLDNARVQVNARAELGVSSGHLCECRGVSSAGHFA